VSQWSLLCLYVPINDTFVMVLTIGGARLEVLLEDVWGVAGVRKAFPGLGGVLEGGRRGGDRHPVHRIRI
jgi:hypothetical protein